MANTKIPSELIADSSITAAKLADGTITTADIADSNVTTAKIADSNVTTAKIGDAQVTTAKITDANVTTVKIADDAVTTAKMASNSVTSDTLASGLTLAGNTNIAGTVIATNLLIDTDVIVTDSTNDRVGINKTSPATTLDVGGSIYFSSVLRGTSDGSESSPSIQPGNDGDTGLFRPATNTIGFTTGGTERMRINSTGIDVTGTVTADYLAVGTTSDAYSQVLINSSTTGESELRMGDTDTDAGSIAYTNSNDTMTFRAAAGARMSLNSTGLTVEGDALSMSHTGNTSTISLTQKAGTQNSVATISANREDTSTPASRLVFSTNDGTSTLQRLRINNAGDISFYEDTGTTAKFFWDASAERLGIGTDNPTSKLSVVGGASDPGISIKSGGNAGVDPFRVTWTNGTEGSMFIIDDNGNVGIGDTSPDNKLSIRAASTIGTKNGHIMLTGDSATNGQGPQIVFSESGVSSDFAGASVGYARTGSNGIGDLIFGTRATSGDANTVPTERMRIDSSGNVGIGMTSAPIGSDTVLSIYNSATPRIKLHNSTTGSASGDGGEINMSGNIMILENRENAEMRFYTNGAERMQISNNGNLEFKSTTTTFTGASSFTNHSNGVLYLRGGTSGLRLDDDDSHNTIHVSGAGNYIAFETLNGTERWRFNSSGHFTPAQQHTVDIGGTNAEVRNIYAQGISFASSTNISGMSSELLNDYEEGTWSPTLANAYNIGSLSLTEAGAYVKVGNLVHVDFDVTGSFTNAAVESRFSFTLPFNTATTSSRATGMFAHLLTSFSNARFNNGQVFQGTTTNSQYWVYIGTNQLSGTGNFNGRVTLTYRAG
jgi:hypothetical protein